MSSSRHASKFMKSISKFQKISLHNKSAYEGSETKSFSWLPFGWSRSSYQENFDGLNDSFNSTGIVADSIFMFANPEAAPLQQEKILLSSQTKCPAQRMLDQQTTHSHPKLKDLYRRRCGLPIDANEVKDPLTDEQKKFIEKLKRCPNNPPTLDQFQGLAQQGYSHVNTNVSLPGNAELVSELPYWVKTDTSLPVALNLRSSETYLANVSDVETEKNSQVEDTAHTYARLVDTGIDNTSSLPTQNVFCQSSKVTTNKSMRFFSSNSKKSKSEKKKCHKLPSSVPPPSSQGKCIKAKAVGCGSHARENCNPVMKQRDQRAKLEVPLASYADCLKDPTLLQTMSECTRKNNGLPEQCRTPNEGLSVDGCDPLAPTELGACTKRIQACPRSNASDENKDGCDPSIKPFKSAASSAPSSINCPLPYMKSRVSELGSLRFPFSTPKRCFSSKDNSGKPRKSKKGNDPRDWLNSKSPNECKSRRAKCDPKIKPFKNKNASPPLVRTLYYGTPIISRVSNARDLVSPHNPPKRFFSAATNKAEKQKKPCFEAKKIKPHVTEDTHSRVSCERQDVHNRCEKAKCNPSLTECKKPAPIHQHRCPKKPVQGKRKKKVRVVARKMLLGYKICDKPPRARPFQCNPKEDPVVRKGPTPKRCPCFAPIDFDQKLGNAICRKMPNAVEPNCNKPRRPDAVPKGKCEHC